MEMQELLSNVAMQLINIKDFSAQVNLALDMIGTSTQVSRVYIFEDDTNSQTTSNTYEWVNSGISLQMDELQEIPYEMIPSWRHILTTEGRVYSEDISELPEDVRAILEPQNILSIVVYPLYIGDSIKGFVGYDDCTIHRHWTMTELQFLKIISGILSTVFERIHTEERIKTQERNFRTFFENTADLVIITNQDRRIIHANWAAIQRLGYPLKRLKTMSLQDLHPEEQHEDASRIVQEQLSGRRSGSYVSLSILAKAGYPIPVDMRAVAGTWDEQSCVFIIFRDISVQQATLQRFNSIFRNNPALMAVTSLPDRRFSDVNEAFLNHLGYSREEVIGKTIDELDLFPETRSQRHLVSRMLREGHIRDVELKIRSKNGTIIDGLLAGELIKHDGMTSIISVTTDITELNRLRQEEQEQRIRLENIISSTNTGTWEWNILTGETLYNSRWAEMIGYTLEELSPISMRTWEHLTHPEDFDRSQRLLEQHFSGETPYYIAQIRMRHKKGHWVWIQDRGRVIEWTPEGSPARMFGTHTDISDQKELSISSL